MFTSMAGIMDGACGVLVEEEKLIQGFWGGGNVKEGDYLEDPGIDRRVKKLGGSAYTGFIS